MPKGRKARGVSRDKSPRSILRKNAVKGLRKQVKRTRAKIEKGVMLGLRANRKVRSRIREGAKELSDRLAQETRRRLDLEQSIEARNEELKALEMKLEALDKAEAMPARGKAKATVGETKRGGPVNINTSKSKHKKGVQATADGREVKEYKDLLEKRLEAEDDELALVKEQLARLEEKGRSLDERENRLKAVEQELNEGACSLEMDTDIKEMREGLEERLSILEQRSKKLDMLEAELARMERFVDAKRTSLRGKRPHAKGGRKARARKRQSRSHEEE